MTVSPEVAEAVRKVREMKDYIAADKKADEILKQQLADAKSAQSVAETKLSALEAQISNLQGSTGLSQEDKDALQRAFDDAADAQSIAGEATTQAAETHAELKDAVPANAEIPPQAAPAEPAAVPSVAEQQSAQQEKYQGMTADELAEERGREKESGPVEVEPIQAPLMPTAAFDPAGTTMSAPAAAPPGDGQPSQPAAIPTAGGFVVAGGGATQRAPGSDAQNPSSTITLPAEAVAAADAAAVEQGQKDAPPPDSPPAAPEPEKQPSPQP